VSDTSEEDASEGDVDHGLGAVDPFLRFRIEEAFGDQSRAVIPPATGLKASEMAEVQMPP
jgi:hypothetical protein